jgi:hypothetical protein
VSARLKLAAVVAVCAAPFVLGWLAYEYHWFSGQSGNYGELLAAIEGSHVVPATPELFGALPGNYIYLVDPLGNLMMRFPAEPDPSKLIKDLQRLLKYSRFG